MDFLQKIFGAENKLPTGVKSSAEFLEYNGELINRVVQEIIEPFLKPSTTPGSVGKPETDLAYTLKLMDADTCGQMAFFLSKTLNQQIKTYDISGFGGPINTIAPGSKSITESNIQTPNGMVSRKQICDRLAAHYVAILNLIGAILTAINPDTNMALARMNSLYTLVDGTTDKFIINICAPEGKQVVHTNILDEPGLREFLGLYLFHLLSVSESPADKGRVMQEYQNLVRKLVDEDRTVAMPLEIPESEPEPVNNNITQTNTIEPINNITQTNTLEPIKPLSNINISMGQTEKPISTAKSSDNIRQKPGIFNIISDKISAGLEAILPENNTQPNEEQYYQNRELYNQNPEYDQNYVNNYYQEYNEYPPPYMTANEQASYSKQDLKKRLEINKLADEIVKKRKAGIAGNDPEVMNLETKIKTLLAELESSSSYNSSTDSSYKKWLAYKKRAYNSYGTNSSSSTYTPTTTNSSSQYGGDTTISGRLSADASIARFINFMEKYIHENPADKRTIMRNVLTLFKGGHFKKPDTTRIKKLCANANSEGKPITLQIDPNNQYLRTFNDNYLEMRHNYMVSVGELVDILENHILIQNPKTQKMDIRNLSSRELGDLETRTRTILAQLYSTAHTHYVQGVNSLYDYYHNLTSGVNIY
jgi:hypothetical protein